MRPVTDDAKKRLYLSDVGQQGKSVCLEDIAPCATLEVVGSAP